MDEEREQAAVATLLRAPGVTQAVADDLVERFGSAVAVVEAPAAVLAMQPGISRSAASAIAGGEPLPGAAEATLRRVVLRIGWLMLRRIHITLIAAAAGFGVGWILNVWIMGARFDGFRVPGGSTATGEGNFVRGTVFWFVVSALVSSLVAYRLTVGKERFWADVRELPTTVRSALTEDGDRTVVTCSSGSPGRWSSCCSSEEPSQGCSRSLRSRCSDAPSARWSRGRCCPSGGPRQPASRRLGPRRPRPWPWRSASWERPGRSRWRLS
jgi:hypothetical protein